MKKGEVYKSKLDGRKWTIFSFDKKKLIVKSISGKAKRTTNYIRFLNTMEIQNEI